MPAGIMALMLMGAGQDVLTLKIPRPTSSEPWSRTASFIACPAPARGQAVAFGDLPAEVLTDLRRTEPRMSPPGGPFEAGDFGEVETPRARIIGALRLERRLAVAYEKGGRGYSITVLTYEAQSDAGLMTVKGLQVLNPRETRSGRLEISDACEAMERAL